MVRLSGENSSERFRLLPFRDCRSEIEISLLLNAEFLLGVEMTGLFFVISVLSPKGVMASEVIVLKSGGKFEFSRTLADCVLF